MRKGLLAALLVALIVAAWAMGQQAPLDKASPKLALFLPGSNAIGNWVVFTAGDRGAYNDEGLYDLYDGDVPHLKKFGLQAAHQRVYKSGDRRLIVDLMRLDTYQHAKALYGERTQGLTGISGCKTLGGIKEQGMLVPTGGVTVVYFWQRNYLCSISAFGTSSSQQQTAEAFARWIAGKIAQYYSPKKQ